MRKTRLVVLAAGAVLLLASGCGKKDEPASGGQPSAQASSGGTTTTKKATDTTKKGTDTTKKGSDTTKPKAPGTTKATTKPAGGGTKPTVPTPKDGEVVLWAVEAIATSNYGATPGSSWNATNTQGEPDTPECGDYTSAWASEGSATVDTLTVTYDRAVVPSAVVVYETYNPGQTVKVEVVGADGTSTTVYEAKPAETTQCPRALVVSLTGVAGPVNKVKVTVDQSVLGLGWAEIDAVALVGTPA